MIIYLDVFLGSRLAHQTVYHIQLENCYPFQYYRFANMVVYYGIILFTPNLAGDRFVNFVLSALIEIPAYIAAYFVCKK